MIVTTDEKRNYSVGAYTKVVCGGTNDVLIWDKGLVARNGDWLGSRDLVYLMLVQLPPSILPGFDKLSSRGARCYSFPIFYIIPHLSLREFRITSVSPTHNGAGLSQMVQAFFTSPMISSIS